MGTQHGAMQQWRFFGFPAFGLPDATRDLRDEQKSRAKVMNTTLIIEVLYCGIEVELICQMNHCSLVRFKERSFVVDTADLVLEQNFKGTAKSGQQGQGCLRNELPKSDQT